MDRYSMGRSSVGEQHGFNVTGYREVIPSGMEEAIDI